MKTRPLIILVVVLVVLVGLKWMQNISHDASVSTSGLDEILAPFTLDQIGEIMISGPGGGEIILKSQGGFWTVSTSYGHPAKTDRIEKLVSGLAGLKGEIRSRDESVLADYGLDRSQGIGLKLFDLTGGVLGDLVLGKSSGNTTFFVRLADGQEAYAAPGNVLGGLGIWGEEREPKAKHFLDLKAVGLETGDIDSIELEDGTTRLELVKVFEAPIDTMPVDRSLFTWHLGNTELKTSAVTSLAGALVNIQAQELLDPALDYDFGVSGRRVEIRLSDGSVTVIEFGAKVTEPAEGVAMRVFGDESIYLVYDRLPDRIFKKRGDLLPDPVEE